MGISIISSGRKVRDFLVYDLEWVPGTYQLRMVGVYDGVSYRCYHSVSDFLDSEMTSKNRGKWFYAHAGGLADAQFVFEDIIERPEYRVDASFSGSSAIIVHVVRGKNAWHFIDSYWLLRDSLANIGKWIGRQKGSGVEGFESMSPEQKRDWYTSAPFEELRKYNREDCAILWEAIDSFQTAILGAGGQLQMTLASTAMHLFRRKYLSEDIETSRQVNKRAVLAYVASRVEVLTEECEDAWYFDINSSFPAAMTQPCPGNLKKWGDKIPDSGIYMADVKISVPDTYLPPLPYRVEGRIFFPIGSWRAWLTNIDIELLEREGGKVQRVYEVLEFYPCNDLRDYAIDLYRMRMSSENDFNRIVYKLALNSLYGKFAESSDKQSLHINPPLEMLEGDKRRLWPENMMMPGVWIENRSIYVPHAHVPISAHITAIARRSLYDYMAQCIPAGIHYCDTDGFSTNESIIETGKNLGDLKRERKIGRGRYVLPKFYRQDDKVKAKGFSLGRSRNYEHIADAKQRMICEFEELVAGGELQFERMSRLKELYRGGHSHPREEIIRKAMRRKMVPKRFHYPDGTTRPWSILELERMFRK